MPTQRLPMRKLREILRLKHEAGRPHRDIAKAYGVGAGTISEYVQRAADAGLSWPLPDDLGDAALEEKLFSVSNSSSAPRPQPDLPKTHQELSRVGVTLLLWQEYRQVHGEEDCPL